jgi:hypothetical protein
LIGFFNANRFNLVISFRLSLRSCLTYERKTLFVEMFQKFLK